MAIEEVVKGLQSDVKELREAMVEHRIRLQNGTAVFADMRDKIDEVDVRTTPKPPSITKIVAITLTAFLASAGALWALAMMIRDRPTTEQLEKIMDTHHESGHASSKKEVKEIRDEQIEQRVLIEDVVEKKIPELKKEHEETNQKLDQLLQRTETPRNRSRTRNRPQ